MKIVTGMVTSIGGRNSPDAGEIEIMDIEHSGTEALFALAHSATLNVDSDGNVFVILAVDDDREIVLGGGKITATGVKGGVIASYDDVKDLKSAISFLGAPRSSI